MTRRLHRAGIAAALMLGLFVPAAQADTFKATFGPGRENVFNWEGMSSGAPTIPMVLSNGCFDLAPLFRCDLIVFKMEAPGDLEASITIDGPVAADPTGAFGIPDLDLALYVANASGVHPDDAEPVATASTKEATETIKYAAKAGFYVMEVEAFQGQNVTYKGTSKGSGFPAPAAPPTGAPAPPATSTPPPASTPPQSTPPQSKPRSTGKRKACEKKAKKKYKRNKKKRQKALKACKKQPR